MRKWFVDFDWDFAFLLSYSPLILNNFGFSLPMLN